MKYFIYVIIWVFIFLISRKLFCKLFQKENRTLSIVSGILAIVITPLVVKGIFILFFNLILYEYHPERDFTLNSWRKNVEDRHEMANDLLRSKILMHKSKTEVVDEIGLPNDKFNLEQDTLSNWQYNMGNRRWGFGLKFYILNITFEKGQSVEIDIKEAID